MIEVRDALGRTVRLERPAQRVVSLVPSETETVAALAGVERLVGRTRFCEEPRGRIERVAVCGGTKDVDVARVLALAPDLVLANQEENTRASVEALAAHVPVHVSFPKRMRDAIAYLDAVSALLGVDGSAERDALTALVAVREAHRAPAVRVFVPVWFDPWMTFDEHAYASDVLELAGAINVFAGRPRRYPLSADLGAAQPWDAARVGRRDTRYPRTTLQEIVARAPDVVLLPDEPFAFTAEHAALLAASLPQLRVRFANGKDLFWYGVRARSGLTSVIAQLAAL